MGFTRDDIRGKRRHNSSLLNLNTGNLSNGGNPVDLDLIPSSAIARIEVLRDGAAAQYGSDAIAGVINIILKDTEGGFLSGSFGENFDRGDGQLWQFQAAYGTKVGDKGFINVFATTKSQELSNRAIPVASTIQIYPRLIPSGLPDPRELTVDRLVTKNSGVLPQVGGRNGIADDDHEPAPFDVDHVGPGHLKVARQDGTAPVEKRRAAVVGDGEAEDVGTLDEGRGDRGELVRDVNRGTGDAVAAPSSVTIANPPVIKVPVLVIHGMKDTALNAAGHAGTWNHVAEDTTILMIPGAGDVLADPGTVGAPASGPGSQDRVPQPGLRERIRSSRFGTLAVLVVTAALAGSATASATVAVVDAAAAAQAAAITALQTSVATLTTTVASLVASMTAQIKVINATMLKIQKAIAALRAQLKK